MTNNEENKKELLDENEEKDNEIIIEVENDTEEDEEEIIYLSEKKVNRFIDEAFEGDNEKANKFKELNKDKKFTYDSLEQELIDFISREHGLSDEDYEEYKKDIEKIKNQLDDEDFEIILNNIMDTINAKPEDKIKYRKEILNNLKEEKAMALDMERAIEESKNAIDESRKKVEDMLLNMDYSDLLVELDTLRSNAKDENENQFFELYDNLYKEVDNILNFTSLKNKVEKLKNKKDFDILKLKNISDENYKKEFRKFVNLLGSNKKYKFPNPANILIKLENQFPDSKKEYAKIFIFNFIKYINEKDNKKPITERVDNSAVFIEGIIKNISSLDNDNFKDKDRFIKNIYEFVDSIK